VDLVALPRELALDPLVQLEEFAGFGLLGSLLPIGFGWVGKVAAPLIDPAQVLPEGGNDVGEVLQVVVDLARPDRRGRRVGVWRGHARVELCVLAPVVAVVRGPPGAIRIKSLE
jgi:hypothetical protein